MSEGDFEIELEKRRGLPEPLRALLGDYPRNAWEANAHFSALIRFWLDRHVGFRHLLEALLRETREALDCGNEQDLFGARLAQLGGLFINELHGHHMVEDIHYFPHLKMLDKRISHGFDILDRDHHVIDGHLAAFAEEVNAVLWAIESNAPANTAFGILEAGLVRLDRTLRRHLEDEEELVVPVLLKYAPAGLV